MKTPRGFLWLPVLLVVLGLVIVGGGVGVYMLGKTSQPQAPIYQPTDATPETIRTTNTPSATIDSSSLMPVSGSVLIITGTASGISSALYIVVADVDNHMVSQAGVSVAKGVWSVTMHPIQTDVFAPGQYRISVYNDTNGPLLASGVMNIAPLTSAVPGMSKYTDTDFGFSFWYPSDKKIESTQITAAQDSAYKYGVGAQVVKTIIAPEFSLEEVSSPSMSILSAVDAGCCGSNYDKYFFDTQTHTWMYADDGGPKGGAGGINPADVSKNTMGGLHIFPGYTRFGNKVIIPLSATHFLVLYSACNGASEYDCGSANDPTSGYSRFYAALKTIVATDPSVATPVSAAEQQAVIQAEKSAYGGSSSTLPNPGNLTTDQIISYSSCLGGVNYSTLPAYFTCKVGHSVGYNLVKSISADGSVSFYKYQIIQGEVNTWSPTVVTLHKGETVSDSCGSKITMDSVDYLGQTFTVQLSYDKSTQCGD